MSVFKRKAKPRACAKCGAMFVPMAGQVLFLDLCHPHRDEAAILKGRKDAVAHWAARNWEALEPLSKINSHTITLSGNSGGGRYSSGNIEQYVTDAQNNIFMRPLKL